MGHDGAVDPELTLPVVEVFGPTLQGEGPFAGRAASFIRLGGCNLACSWCDTAYSWDASRYDLRREISRRTVSQILLGVSANIPIVILTGGEPLLYAGQAAFGVLLHELRKRGHSIHVESNGTRFPPDHILDLLDVVVLSPKLSNAGSHRPGQKPELHPGWSGLLKAEVYLKYVCENESDVELALLAADSIGWNHEKVWVMPQATAKADLDNRWQVVADAAARRGINATSRLHLLAWGDARAH